MTDNPIKTVGDIKKVLEKSNDDKPIVIWDLGSPSFVRARKNKRLRKILNIKDAFIIEVEDDR